MGPPYNSYVVARSLVRIPGSGRDDPKASILCDLSRVSTLVATFPIPRNLPPALVGSPNRLRDTNIHLQNLHLRGHNPWEERYNASSPSSLPLHTSTAYTQNGSSDPRKRTRDQVFRGDESYSTLKVSKLENAPVSPRHVVNVGGSDVTSSNRGSTITPAVVVLIPNHMHPFISTSQPQEGRIQTPQVLVTQPQDSPASLGVVTQLHQPMAHLQSLFHHARSAPEGVVVQVQSLLQQATNLLQQATNSAPQGAVAQVPFLPQQSNIPIQKEAAPQPSPPVPQIVAVPQQSYVPQNVIPQQSHLQPTNPSPQKVVVPHQSHLQSANPTPQKVVVFHQNYLQQTNQSPNNIKIQQLQLEPNISKQNMVVDAMCMTEVAEEVRQLREDNHTLRRQVSLLQQLFHDKERLRSVIRTLGVL